MFASFEQKIECSPLLVTQRKKLPPFDQSQIIMAVVVAYIIYLLNTLYCIMKYNLNTANSLMYIDKSTINFTNGKQFCGKTLDGM
jgi:hypothetical protein